MNIEAERIYDLADYSRYYKNNELQEWIKDTKIIQVFLLPY
jgi:hypothetical protein